MDPETLLLRQINPCFVQNGRLTSQAFRPTPKDENMLSVENGHKIEPSASWERFTSSPECRSVGVMAVTFTECSGQDLPVVEDGVPFPEHCSIDFSGLSKSLIEKKAKVLAQYAIQRNWLFKAIQEV